MRQPIEERALPARSALTKGPNARTICFDALSGWGRAREGGWVGGQDCSGHCTTRTQNGAILRRRDLADDDEAIPSRVRERWAHAGKLSAGLFPETSERAVAQR
jgi:hypothetical protein